MIISIKGVQRYENADPDTMELVTAGRLEREGNSYTLSYQESELTGLEGTLTTFQIEPDRVTLLRVGEEDVVIGISFPRYSSRAVQAMSFARDRGATTVAITDSEVSPLASIAQYTLKARSDMASFVDSLVAPLSLVNALLVAVSRKKNEDLSKTFETLEKIWEEYGVYEKTLE